MRAGWIRVVVTAGALAHSACSLVLDPADYVGDGDGGVTPPPPPVGPPPPAGCGTLSMDPPPWRGCPFVQQGPASFDIPLLRGELALAAVPGGDSVRGFGAIGFIEADEDITIGTFSVEDIDLSSPFDLSEMSTMSGATSLALRGYDENNISMNVIAGSTADTSINAWLGRVSAADVFELQEIYGNEGVVLLPRAAITGGFMPSPATQVFPIRNVWRATGGGGDDAIGSLDEAGASTSFVASFGRVPADPRVELADSSGEWIAVSSLAGVSLWRTDVDGLMLQDVNTDGREGGPQLELGADPSRAVIAAAGTGCDYVLAYPRTTGIVMVPMVCNTGCTELSVRGRETVIPTDGAPSLVAIATMPEGGWVVAAVEQRDGGNPVVVTRLVSNALAVVTTLDALAPTGFDALMGPSYLDLRVAVVQRMSGYHVIVAASHDQGGSGSATPHWVAAFHGCGA